MKKVFSFLAISLAVVAFTACGGNKNNEEDTLVADTEQVVVDEPTVEEEIVAEDTIVAEQPAAEPAKKPAKKPATKPVDNTSKQPVAKSNDSETPANDNTTKVTERTIQTSEGNTAQSSNTRRRR